MTPRKTAWVGQVMAACCSASAVAWIGFRLSPFVWGATFIAFPIAWTSALVAFPLSAGSVANRLVTAMAIAYGLLLIVVAFRPGIAAKWLHPIGGALVFLVLGIPGAWLFDQVLAGAPARLLVLVAERISFALALHFWHRAAYARLARSGC